MKSNYKLLILIVFLLGCKGKHYDDGMAVVFRDSADFVNVKGRIVDMNAETVYIHSPQKIVIDTCGQVLFGTFYIPHDCTYQISGMIIIKDTVWFTKESKIILTDRSGKVTKVIMTK